MGTAVPMLRRMIGSAWLLGTSLATVAATDLAGKAESLRLEGERVRLEATKRIHEQTEKLRQEGERVRQEAAEKVRHEAVPAGRALLDLHPDRARRRCWRSSRRYGSGSSGGSGRSALTWYWR